MLTTHKWGASHLPATLSIVATSLTLAVPSPASPDRAIFDPPSAEIDVGKRLMLYSHPDSAHFERDELYKIVAGVFEGEGTLSFSSIAEVLCRGNSSSRDKYLEALLEFPGNFDAQYATADAINRFAAHIEPSFPPALLSKAERVSASHCSGGVKFYADAQGNFRFDTDFVKAARSTTVSLTHTTLLVFKQSDLEQLNQNAVPSQLTLMYDPGSAVRVFLHRGESLKLEAEDSKNPQAEKIVHRATCFISQGGEPGQSSQYTFSFVSRHTDQPQDPHQYLYLDSPPEHWRIIQLCMLRAEQALYFSKQAGNASEPQDAHKLDNHPLRGKQMPNLELSSPAGEKIYLSEILQDAKAGVLVEVGFPRCIACIRGIPSLIDLANTQEVRVISIQARIGIKNSEDPFELLNQLMKKLVNVEHKELPFPVYLAPEKVETTLKSPYMPTYFLIDKSGVVREVYEGGHMTREQVRSGLTEK